MSTEPINVGVIGLGMGMFHLDAYRDCPSAKIAAVCDCDADWVAHVAEERKVPLTFTDYHRMLQDPEIDAVTICLPTARHAEATIEALNAGKHVLCEKPMARNAAEADAMVSAAKATGKVLMISQNQRFTNEAQYLRKAMDERRFGDVYFVRTGWRRTMGSLISPVYPRGSGTVNRNWFNQSRAGGGVLRDLGSHMLDLALWLLDFPKIDDVFSANYAAFTPDFAAQYGHEADAEDFAAGMIRFDNGASLQLETSFGSYVEADVVYLDLYGTAGGVSLRNDVLKVFGQDHDAYFTSLNRFPSPPGCAQADFLRAIQTETPPLVTGQQGAAVIKLLDALYAGGTRIFSNDQWRQAKTQNP